MTTPNDDLVRAALEDAASTVTEDGLRPLAAPVSGGRGRLRLRWAFPGVAMLAAALLALLVLAVPRVWDGGRGGPAMSPAAYAGAEYVLEGTGMGPAAEVTIEEVATGRTIGRVRAPAGSGGFLHAAGAGDNRTFYLATADARACLVRFHRLVLGEDGAPGPLEPMPELAIPGRPADGFGLLAVAKGGGRLAYSTVGCGPGAASEGRITIVLTGNGARTHIDLIPGATASQLRWARDEEHVSAKLARDGADGYELWVFGGGDDVRRVTFGDPAARLVVGTVAPDGDEVVAVLATGDTLRMVWYSLDTGTITRRVPLPGASAKDGAIGGGELVEGRGGDGYAVLIGDRLYRVRGTAVESEPVRDGGGLGGGNGVW
ncbi:hypothetical protein [Actinomadura sp. 21ATH]|uniref:hypothetical protein n=1 Tax=Actinomadura sp. 21ATH TaxID=1735444 RepID=UPI0035BEE83E